MMEGAVFETLEQTALLYRHWLEMVGNLIKLLQLVKTMVIDMDLRNGSSGFKSKPRFL